MVTPLMKHNPAFLTEAELVSGFVARRTELDLLVETVRENTATGANQHVLVIGSRGMGKTTLVRRVAAAVRHDAELARRWVPIVFAEESYTVSTAGELWLEAVSHLAAQTQDQRWRRAHEELRGEPDDDRLATRALARLMDFADERGARLLLVIENLHMLLGEQLDGQAAWSIRHTLQNEKRIMLLATSTARFAAIERPREAMYELFRVMPLEPLDTDDIMRVWRAVSGHELSASTARPIGVLTGGNARLVAVLAAFGARRSFRDLMRDITRLVDDHTSYFKAAVEELPAAERKVFVTLADIWAPATSRQVAQHARTDVNKASANLKRLVDRGAVVEVRRIGRVALYQVAERMYNIYHLLRGRSAEREQVRALVDFMIHFYERTDLVGLANGIVVEALGLPAAERARHLVALDAMFAKVRHPDFRKELLEVAVRRLEREDDCPPALLAALRSSVETGAEEPAIEELLARCEAEPLDMHWWGLLAQKLEPGSSGADPAEIQETVRRVLGNSRVEPLLRAVAAAQSGDLEAAAEILDQARKQPGAHPHLHVAYAEIRLERGDLGNACDAVEAAVELAPLDAVPLVAFGRIHFMAGRLQEAEQALLQATEIAPDDAKAWSWLGAVQLQGANWHGASVSLSRALSLQPDDTMGQRLWCLTQVLIEESTPEGLDVARSLALRTDRTLQDLHVLSAVALGHGDLDEALRAAGLASVESPELAWPHVVHGEVAGRSGDFEAAERHFRAALALEPMDEAAFRGLVQSLALAGDLSGAMEAANSAPRLPALWVTIFKAAASAGDGATAEVAATVALDPWSAEVADKLAWAAHRSGRAELLALAEGWAARAVADDPGNLDYRRTWAAVLGALGRWDDALPQLQGLLAAPGYVASNLSSVTDVLLEPLAAGLWDQLAALIDASPAAPLVAPIREAIRLHAGEVPAAPEEVGEVAKDVLAHVRESATGPRP